MNCKNCEAPLQGNFCSACGQKAEIHRITFKYVIHELIHAFTHTDKGFFLLIKSLIIKPGIVAREYLEGKRRKYFNPLSFLVITSALSFFATYHSGYYTTQGGNSGSYPSLWREVFEISNSNGKLLDLFLIIPLATIVSWVLFRRPKYNLAEHLVLLSFLFGQVSNVRTFVFVPLHLLVPQLGSWNLGIFQLLLVVYLIFAYRQFFVQNIFLTILKIVLMMVFYIVLYWSVLLAYVYMKHLLF